VDKPTICSGEAVELTASPGVGGNQTYEWFEGTTSLGSGTTLNLPSVTTTRTVFVRYTTDLACAAPQTDDSDPVTITVTPSVTPSVSIAASNGTTAVCEGTSITLTANPTNQNTSVVPTYSWTRSTTTGVQSTTNQLTASNFAASPGETVTVEMTVAAVSGTYCPTSLTASNTFTPLVSPNLTPNVTITQDLTATCTGNAVSFSITSSANAGTAPTYQWLKGGNPIVGETGSTLNYSPSAAEGGTTLSISLQMTSSEVCTANNPTTSNALAINVISGITGGAIQTSDPTTICLNGAFPNIGNNVTTPSTAVTPSYVWQYSLDGNEPWTNTPVTGLNPSLPFPIPTNVAGTIFIRRFVTDAGSPAPCNVAASNSIMVTILPPLTPGDINGTQTVCANDVISTSLNEVTSAGGRTNSTDYVYSWEFRDAVTTTFTAIASTNSISYTPSPLVRTTEFRRTVTDGLGCTAVSTTPITITVNPYEDVSVSVVSDATNPICLNTNVTYTATPSTNSSSPTYRWFVGSVLQSSTTNVFVTSALPVGNNTIRVEMTSTEACRNNNGVDEETAQTVVINNITPEVSIVASENPKCDIGVVTFTATPQGSSVGITSDYAWFVIPNGSSTPVPVGNNENTYTASTDRLFPELRNGDVVYVEIIPNIQCKTTTLDQSNRITMDIRPTPTPIILGRDTSLCSGQSVVYTASITSGNTIQWYNGSNPIVGQTGISLTVNNPGSYYFIESNNYCQTPSNARYTVQIVQTPIANAGVDQVVLENDLVTLTGSGGTNYTWSPAAGLSNPNIPNPTFSAVQTTTYTLTVSDATNRCSSSDEVTIIVERPIRIPNAITVNGDGQNDVWDIENMSSFPNAVVEVYNRWGTLVWKSVGYDKMWDGTNYRNGEVLPDGTYFYIIILNSTKFPDPYKGYIQVIR
jgi:gliding motility-associated-like protein